MPNDFDRDGVAGRVIGAAIAVHRTLGPGFVEAIYEEALCLELDARRIEYARQVELEIPYRGRIVGTHRVDLLVEGELIVELKAVSELHDAHFGIVRSYLRAARRPYGLLLNFASSLLEKRRVFAEAKAIRARARGEE